MARLSWAVVLAAAALIVTGCTDETAEPSLHATAVPTAPETAVAVNDPQPTAAVTAPTPIPQSPNRSGLLADGEIAFAGPNPTVGFAVDAGALQETPPYFLGQAGQAVLIEVLDSESMDSPGRVTLRSSAGEIIPPAVELTEVGVWDGRLPADDTYIIEVETTMSDVWIRMSLLDADTMTGPARFVEMQAVEVGELRAAIFSSGGPSDRSHHAVVQRDGVVVDVVPHGLSVSAGDRETGARDLNDDGRDDLVVSVASGETSACCFATQVYLSGQLEAVWSIETGSCRGRFEDLDGDGKAEFVTCDDFFFDEFCGYQSSPRPPVAFTWSEEENTWVIATPELDLNVTTPQADSSSGDIGLCRPLGGVLHHLYLGSAERAYEELTRSYDGPGGLMLWTYLLHRSELSDLYVAPSDLAATPVATELVFEAGSTCDPEATRIGVSVRPAEAERCGAESFELGGNRLAALLAGTDVLTENEWLRLERDDDDGARLTVVEKTAGEFQAWPETGELALNGNRVVRLDGERSVVAEVVIAADMTVMESAEG